VTPPPVGRFAPSPTGPLHQGSLVAALASYLAAKSQGGQWLVRIEDLDPVREIAGMADRQLAALEAFGLVSDLPVVLQSRRSAHYEAALEQLLRQGKAFDCRCSRSLLAAEDGIHRHCVNTDGRGPASIRLRAADAWIEFNDGVFGRQRQNLARQVGDFVLKRADGLYAYQLAVVVDDALQGISQIVRGADLLDSTPRQIFLQRQLGYPTPEYLHVPLVRDENGLKLGKSQWATALDPGSRFRAFHAAWRHLGQDVGVLRPDLALPDNLQIALRHFSPASIPAPADHGPP
jgi:glutamyl-Q tRNA(Asp) synthetase